MVFILKYCYPVASTVLFNCSQKLGDVKIGPDESTGELQTGFQRSFNKVVWLIGTSRNAIMVIVCGIIGFYLFRSGAEAQDQLLVYIGESAQNSSNDSCVKPGLFNLTL